MFILRIIADKGQSNQVLGESYNLITTADGDYQKMLEDWGVGEPYAFIVYKEGSEIRPLYKAQKNFIMLPNGQTFANLTFK